MQPVYDHMMTKDMSEVHAIDEANNGYDAWHAKQFRKHATSKDVAEVAYHPDTGELMGFYLYRVGKKKIFLHKFEVSAKGRELDFHKYMLARLLRKCKPYERETIELMTPDTSDYLKTHLFLKECGFFAKNVRNFYGSDASGTPNDGYCWTLKGSFN